MQFVLFSSVQDEVSKIKKYRPSPSHHEFRKEFWLFALMPQEKFKKCSSTNENATKLVSHLTLNGRSQYCSTYVKIVLQFVGSPTVDYYYY